MSRIDLEQFKDQTWNDTLREQVKIIHQEGKGRGVLEIDVFGKYIMVLEKHGGWKIVALVDANDTNKPVQDLHDVRQYIGFEEINSCKYRKQGFELVISHSEQESSDDYILTKQEVARIEVLTSFMFNPILPEEGLAVIVRKDLEEIERKSVKPIELPKHKKHSIFAQI